MRLPGREPGDVLEVSQRMSGPVPAIAAFHRCCDRTVSQKCLEPFGESQQNVSNGHGPEISTMLWDATRVTDLGLSSRVLNPMGGRCRRILKPKQELGDTS
jgi:hypothetical protein